MEIEIKLKTTKETFKKYLEKLESIGENKKIKEQHDIYFSPEEPNFFGKVENDQCLRIRIQNNQYILSYKSIIFGEKETDIHLIEHETVVENLEETKNILKSLNINEIITLNKKRISFFYLNTFEISFDEVEDLGYFIEIEIIDSTLEVEEANKRLINLINEWKLDIKDRDLIGYANALYDLKYRH